MKTNVPINFPIRQLIILMGLPGSGKTTFANEEWGNNCSYQIINLDSFFDGNQKVTTLEKIIEENYNCVSGNLVLDGLFLENNHVESAIHSVIKALGPDFIFKNKRNTDFYVTIHYWNENREDCLSNDFGRREKSSDITIKHANFEKPDVEYLMNLFDFDIQVKYHDVRKYSNRDSFIIKYKNKGNIYESPSWSRGGTYGTYCDDEFHTIYAEPQPEFKKLDEILEDVCPEITYLQYKKIYRSCVRIIEESEYDYYGGCEKIACYQLNLDDLFTMLHEMNLVEE